MKITVGFQQSDQVFQWDLNRGPFFIPLFYLKGQAHTLYGVRVKDKSKGKERGE